MIKPQTLKGFRDFLPEEASKRQYVIDIIRKTFELYGFEPLETPALEYEEILLGKYGEEGDKLMYRFEDLGGRKVALRYDQTVPLARVVAQYKNQLPFLFKRYQIQPVWRAENPQKGRFREFLQCDIDTVGTSSPLSDAEIISCALNISKKLGFKNTKMWINDRINLDSIGLTKKEIIILDKLEKIGEKLVITELQKIGRNNAAEVLSAIKNSKPSDRLNKIFSSLKEEELQEGRDFLYIPFLARGLDYYTSTIFELKADDYSQSLAGGGRFDNLIGMFTNNNIPAVGIAFGFDRIIEAMDELNLFPKNIKTSSTKALVTVFDDSLVDSSIKVLNLLRKANINSEIYYDLNQKLDKQLKYADKKGIPFAVIIGPSEVESGMVTIKNMKEKKQETMKMEKLISTLNPSKVTP